ncbi:MAG: hemolysin family protein [Candidatus Electrothrix sp. GW3-4]|uniref:hemolysin family protein n=1 Tax=Candidatus Electrothrix sp. GW3-4 TaxID=3126740 RepID=UPI0030D23619
MAEKKEDNGRKSLWQRVKSLAKFRRSPDTTQELEHEIQGLLENGEEQGLISSHEEQLINSIFHFRATVASEIMTPTAEIVRINVKNSVQEAIALINVEGYTRIPVFSGSQDNIIGILHAKDLLRTFEGRTEPERHLENYLNPPMIISESKPITELLREFQAKKNHIAVVTDEFGGVRGLITLEDVIEEIVGEIDDEHDQEERELMQVDQQTVVVDAKIDIEEVEKHFQCRLPEGPYESIGGFIIHCLGRMPQNGETVESAPLTLTVLVANPRKVRTVRIRKV